MFKTASVYVIRKQISQHLHNMHVVKGAILQHNYPDTVLLDIKDIISIVKDQKHHKGHQ